MFDAFENATYGAHEVSYGYRTIVVVDDCCGDPAQDSHDANLGGLSRRYVDVRQRSEVLTYFDEAGGRN